MNGVLALVTLSFLGLSIAPLITSILTPSPQQVAQTSQVEVQNSETERLKIQIEGFEAVLKREPKNETALKGLIDLRLRLRDFQGTLEPLETLADSNPKEVQYRRILAQVQTELKNQPAAIAEYRKILAESPTDLESIQIVVAAELEAKKPEAAIGILDKAIKAADTVATADKPALLWLLGNVYTDQKRFSEAIATFDQITAIDAKDFRPLVGRAQIKRLEGKETEAQALFTEAAKLAPAEFRDRVNELAKTPAKPETTPATP